MVPVIHICLIYVGPSHASFIMAVFGTLECGQWNTRAYIGSHTFASQSAKKPAYTSRYVSETCEIGGSVAQYRSMHHDGTMTYDNFVSGTLEDTGDRSADIFPSSGYLFSS